MSAHQVIAEGERPNGYGGSELGRLRWAGCVRHIRVGFGHSSGFAQVPQKPEITTLPAALDYLGMRSGRHSHAPRGSNSGINGGVELVLAITITCIVLRKCAVIITVDTCKPQEVHLFSLFELWATSTYAHRAK